MNPRPLDRRSFAKRLVTGASTLAAAPALTQSPVNPDNRAPVVGPDGQVRGLEPPRFTHTRTSGTLQADGTAFLEAARPIPVKGDFDVIVCGGGPATA